MSKTWEETMTPKPRKGKVKKCKPDIFNEVLAITKECVDEQVKNLPNDHCPCSGPLKNWCAEHDEDRRTPPEFRFDGLFLSLSVIMVLVSIGVFGVLGWETHRSNNLLEISINELGVVGAMLNERKDDAIDWDKKWSRCQTLIDEWSQDAMDLKSIRQAAWTALKHHHNQLAYDILDGTVKP